MRRSAAVRFVSGFRQPSRRTPSSQRAQHGPPRARRRASLLQIELIARGAGTEDEAEEHPDHQHAGDEQDVARGHLAAALRSRLSWQSGLEALLAAPQEQQEARGDHPHRARTP